MSFQRNPVVNQIPPLGKIHTRSCNKKSIHMGTDVKASRCTHILFNVSFPPVVPAHSHLICHAVKSDKCVEEKKLRRIRSVHGHAEAAPQTAKHISSNDLRIEVVPESSLFQWFHAVLLSIRGCNERSHNSNVNGTQGLLNRWMTWFCNFELGRKIGLEVLLWWVSMRWANRYVGA